MVYLRSFFAFAALAMTLVQYSWAVNVPGDYNTIQAAITELEANPGRGDTINVARGVYRENIVFSGSNPITIIGDETAATFLEADDESNAILSISNASSVVVRNFTFRSGNRGIVLTNSNGVIIASNVFRLRKNGDTIAINSDASTRAEIINNTFYNNRTAIDRSNEATEVRNNIFDNNNIAISPSTVTGMVSYNCFSGNVGIGIELVNNKDPLFVNTSLGDFHLRKNSPCINAGEDDDANDDVIDGTRADMGAYGGRYADVFPFKVQNVTVSTTEGTPSISVSWSVNESYRVSGYRLYYGSDQSGLPYNGTDAFSGTETSPIDVDDIEDNVTDNVKSFIIRDLDPSSITPETPAISGIKPSNQTLDISWGAVTSATGYRLYYGENDPRENEINVGTVTRYSLRGLTNGVTYRVAVSALHQATYYLSVTAYNNTEPSNHESNYSDEKSLAIGDEIKSGLSAIEEGIPEAVVPFPLLPDEGCFIATVAFGYYDAPQVQLLRDFRDRYLLSHSPGRWFVKQYYTYGPEAARYIERHPEWKSSVRVALLPLIAMTWVLFKAAWFIQAVIAMSGLAMIGGLYLWRKKQASMSINHAREIFS